MSQIQRKIKIVPNGYSLYHNNTSTQEVFFVPLILVYS